MRQWGNLSQLEAIIDARIELAMKKLSVDLRTDTKYGCYNTFKILKLVLAYDGEEVASDSETIEDESHF